MNEQCASGIFHLPNTQHHVHEVDLQAEEDIP
jgi:hypothetical protein